MHSLRFTLTQLNFFLVVLSFSAASIAENSNFQVAGPSSCGNTEHHQSPLDHMLPQGYQDFTTTFDQPSPLPAPLAANRLETRGELKIATILVSSGNLEPSCDRVRTEAAHNSKSQINVEDHMYLASSKNIQLNFDGDGNGSSDIFGPFNIGPVQLDSCFDSREMSKIALRQAKSAGIDFNSYDIITYIMPESNSFCWYKGWAEYCDRGNQGEHCEVWILSCDTEIFTHEYGHNIGFRHSHSNHALGEGESAFLEYGDDSCVMGAGYGDITNFNASKHLEAGWLTEENGEVLRVEDFGTYTVSSLDFGGQANNPKLVILELYGFTFHLSYRASTGEYNKLHNNYDNKLSIHELPYPSLVMLRTTLDIGESFHHPFRNFRIKVLSKSASELTFKVENLLGNHLDDDLDGMNNGYELANKTNPSDPGSRVAGRSFGPSYLLWNGFVNIFNYVELYNRSSLKSEVKLTVIGLDGQRYPSKTFVVEQGQKVDIAINELEGFSLDSYGLLEVDGDEFDVSSSSYKFRPGDDSFEFAYNLPREAPIEFSGESIVPFNTKVPEDFSSSDLDIYNWLSLVNFSSNETEFEVNTYSGTRLIASRNVVVSAFGRVDIDGGHGIAGPGKTGFHTIRQKWLSFSSYTAQLVVYAHERNGLSKTNQVRFAYPMSAKIPSGQPQYLSAGDNNGSKNSILELFNNRTTPEAVSVYIYSGSGPILHSKTYLIAPKARFSINTRPFGDLGLVEVLPSSSNSVVAQMVNYYPGSIDSLDRVEEVYATSARESRGAGFTGAYNTFIQMENQLRVVNTSDEEVRFTIEVDDLDGNLLGRYRQLVAPHATHFAKFSSRSYTPNTYGAVRVLADREGALITDMIRIRDNIDGSIDFIFASQFGQR